MMSSPTVQPVFGGLVTGHMKTRMALRAATCLGIVGLLSACAGGQHISASQEAAQYELHAHRSYTPPGSSGDPWGPYIHEAALRFDIPDRWIREVMRVESGGRTEMNGVPITSGAGAMGLMQVMPATYDELRGRYDLGDDPYDPHNSILAGTAYIRELYDLYGSPGFLAAYNGGPGRLDDYLTRNRPLPDETRRYVAKIGPYITDSFPQKRSTAEMYAMNTLPTSIPAGPRYNAPAAVPVDTATAAYVPPAAPPAPSTPVEVAFAPPSDGDGAFDPPPGWTPKGMSRGEVAAYVPPPAEQPRPAPQTYASAQPAPAPVFEPAPMPSYAPPSSPAPAYSAPNAAYVPPAYTPPPAAALPVPPPGPARPSQYAALPEPPHYVPPAPQTAASSGYAPRQGFRFVAPAVAAPAPIYRGLTSNWAIQVGAFGNEGLAKIAVGTAREQAGSLVSGAHPAVASVREPHGTLYRARLEGLSRDAASQACERLSRSRTNCIVLSPDAQS